MKLKANSWLNTPDGKLGYISRKLKANGYKAVMTWAIDENYGDCGSLYLYDRQGKVAIHATIREPYSYAKMRKETKNLGNFLKMLRENSTFRKLQKLEEERAEFDKEMERLKNDLGIK